MSTAIETRGLTKVLGSRRVIDHLDLKVASGEVLALRGANGAGKTTLLGCLANLIRATSGEVFWFGRAIGRRGLSQQIVGMVAHESFLYRELSVEENLLFSARMHAIGEPTRHVQLWLERASLTEVKRLPAGKLSRGMKQRLSIARGLVHDPPLAMLDEPYTGLDSAGRDWLTEILSDLKQRGRTIVFTSHDDQECNRLADRTAWLTEGSAA